MYVKWFNIYLRIIKHMSLSRQPTLEMSVKPGDQVQKGQAIGSVGNTGLSTKSHLHYEVLKNEQPVDPKPYLPGVK
jgi:murein DD-endopeptidase MepM/ murein hydrolase activator NlpD